jgi:class 3 adenylate cyclase
VPSPEQTTRRRRARYFQAVPTTLNDHLPEPPNDPTSLPFEMAYVLFMDIVAYSRLATATQQQIVNRLQRVVRETPEFQRAVAQNQLIGLPTGDGMALVFFGDPQSPVQCAVEVSLALKNLPKLPVRIGRHAGPVYRTSGDDVVVLAEPATATPEQATFTLMGLGLAALAGLLVRR